MQSSSIGSLGPMLENSFFMELATSLNASSLRSTKNIPKNVRMVYPTKENVFNAYGGPLYGGGCLPYSRKTNIKQEVLTSESKQSALTLRAVTQPSAILPPTFLVLANSSFLSLL